MKITLADYVGLWADSSDWTPERQARATDLLARVNDLLIQLHQAGILPRTNPKTGTLVSGETYGGFRPQACPIGSAGSSHKEGQGVDVFDPFGSMGAYLRVRSNLLAQAGLYMESPTATPTWCHLQTRPTRSGMRVFNP